MTTYYVPREQSGRLLIDLPPDDSITITDYTITITKSFLTKKRYDEIKALLNDFLIERSADKLAQPIDLSMFDLYNRYEWQNKDLSIFLYTRNPENVFPSASGFFVRNYETSQFKNPATVDYKPSSYTIVVVKKNPRATLDYYDDFVKHVVNVFKKFARETRRRGMAEVGVAKGMPPDMWAKMNKEFIGGKKTRKARKTRKTRRRL